MIQPPDRYPFNTGPTPDKPWPMVSGQPASYRKGRARRYRGKATWWTTYDGTLAIPR